MTDRKLVSVTWPLALIMSLMLLLSLSSVLVLSSLRAYVSGESHWSKAERQAIAELGHYSDTRDEADFRRFKTEMSVPLGDRVARLELLANHPDIARAAAGLLAGRNDPSDVGGMIRMFRLFRSSALMAPAIRYWTGADAQIVQLEQTGEELHAAMTVNQGAATLPHALLATAKSIHLRVAPLEDGFSSAIGQASRQVAGLLLGLLSICSAVLVALGAAISRRNLRRGEKLEHALGASQELVFLAHERAQVTLGSISDAVISADPALRITYMNAAAQRLTGWTLEEAQNLGVAAVLNIVQDRDSSIVATQLAQVIAGETLSGAANGVILRRRDGSEIPVHERAAPIRDRHGESTGLVLVLRDIERERAFSTRLQYQATHDALTGLANRSEFEAQLAVAIREQRETGIDHALLYLDLDQFKVINDTSGHTAGDELIRQVAWLIGAQLREGDLLARLGGDEFGALLPGCTANQALEVAEVIRRRIADLRFHWDGKLFAINTSIGVLGLGQAIPTVSDTLSAADQACYLAKDNGRNRVQLYLPDDAEVQNRHGEMRWVERIQSALDGDLFVLYAQEIRATHNGTGSAIRAPASHFELLIRMIGSDGELIAPMAFIPAAERYGLMPRVDRWVIKRACHELAILRARGITLPTCMINLSGASVTDASLADFIRDCLRENSLTGNHIGIELTETAAIGHLASAVVLMSRLRSMGCPVALDDFGSGMSSFCYLKALPIDFLKIDGGFIRDIKSDPIDFAVVEAIQRIASIMGIRTVAESVEDDPALQAVLRIGVDYVQGFHISRPMPLALIGKSSFEDSIPHALSA
jgi:diguanylate cyclase (GGDEF)-like protein/PAS domain S-box-containing protein